MWSKRLSRSAAFALIFALLLALPGLAAGTVREAKSPDLRLRIGDSRHQVFLHGYEDGSFRPDGFITRAEEAQMLYNLLLERPDDRAVLADVSPDDWYYDALGLLAAAGAVTPDAAGYVLPKATLTRAQFVMMLAWFFPDQEGATCDYPDVSQDASWYPAIAKATALGWVKGYEDGTFQPFGRITRAEAATIINRALGRSADRDVLAKVLLIPPYSDLKPEHWAYYEILEASIGHVADLSAGGEVWVETDEDSIHYMPGPILRGTELYYADEQGHLLRDQWAGNLYFGTDGRHSCGDAEVDAYVSGVLAEIVTEDMSRLEMLRAAYEYVRDNFTYLGRNHYEFRETGWAVQEAKTMFETGRGNCYCYAGVFCCIAWQLGYDAEPISGNTNWTPRPHAWVEIEFDGVPYIFDTELGWQCLHKNKNEAYDFFMLPYDKYTYDEYYWPYEK